MEIDFLLTLQKVAVLFILIVIGFIAGKSKLISKKGQKDITQLVLYITMPATIFSAMQLEMNKERLNTSYKILGVMIFCYIIMYIIGTLVSSRLPLTAGKKDIFKTSLLLSNTSFMGYPIVLSLLGPEALFYAVVGAGFVFEIISWTFGVYLITRNGNKEFELNFKNIIFSTGILSILVGLVFFIFQWSVPEPINSVINTLTPATSPLAMIVIGLMLSRSNIIEAFKNKWLYLASVFKLFITPTLIITILKLFGITGPALVIPVIMISMPTASYVAMFSDNYGNDAEFASQIIFLTSLLSMLSIPLITLLF